MKILLRAYNGKRYTWETAKYNNGSFYVNGSEMSKCNIVSILNDNRKNYVQCSSCGQVFRRGDKKFEEHKAKAKSHEPCLGCTRLHIREAKTTNSKLIACPEGGFKETLTRNVVLECTNTGWFSYDSIMSDEAIQGCKKRQCENATEIEISDFFTKHPGAFDDIITIDTLLDNGYDVGYNYTSSEYEYPMVDDEYSLYAVINNIGIVDRFYVSYCGESWEVYYSKKYDKLFYDYRGYATWDPIELDCMQVDEIKETIAKLYR